MEVKEKLIELLKARATKYISRKRVGNRWVYKYRENKVSKKSDTVLGGQPHQMSLDFITPEKKQEVIHSESFKKWFGDWEKGTGSKVLTKAGQPQEQYGSAKPLKVFHGTSRGGFSEFEKDKLDKNALYGKGFYFTESKNIAGDYRWKGNPSQLKTSPKETIKIVENFMKTDKYGVEYQQYKSRLGKFGVSNAYGMKGATYEGTIQYLRKLAKDLDLHFEEEIGKRLLEKTIEGTEIKEVFLSIKNPFDIDDGRIKGSDLPKELFDKIIRKMNTRLESLEFYRNETAAKLSNPGLSEIARGNITNDVRYRDEAVAEYKERFENPKFGYDVLTSYLTDTTDDRNETTKLLQSLGYDGLTHIGGHIMGKNIPHRVWIAFEPNQIKATTATDFDQNTNDIYKASSRLTDLLKARS